MRKILAVLMVIGLLVLGFSSLGMAFGGYGMGMGPGYFNRGPQSQQPNYNNPLNLTEEQQSQFVKIQQDFFTKQAETREQIQDKQLEIRRLALKDGTEAEINQLMDEVVGLQEQLSELRLQKLTDLKGILTEEQLDQLTTQLQDNDSFRRPGFGPGYGMRGYGMRGFAGPGSGGFYRGPGRNPGGYNRFNTGWGMMRGCPWF